MKKNIFIVLAVVLTAIAVRFAFSLYGQMMMGKMMAKNATPSVLQGEIQEASVIKQLDAPGRILSQYRVDVLARISGYLNKSYFKEGDHVKKGEVLFLIEPQEYALAVQKSKASLNNAKAQLTYAEKQLNRAAELVKKDYIAKATYDEMLSNRDALRAQVALAQANLNDANRNYGYTRILSPVDGQIGQIALTVGNYVNPSAGAITSINSTNPIFVTFPIDSQEYLTLSEIEPANTKRKVDLIFPNGEKYELQGVQDFHDNKVDETTGTITMRATFQNPKGKLIHGEYVKVIIYANTPVNVPIVPQTAVLENPQGKFVYTMNEQNLPQITSIKTSGQYKDNWIVSEGLKKGDKILVDGLQKVIPDRPVKIVTKEEMEKIKQNNNKKTAK